MATKVETGGAGAARVAVVADRTLASSNTRTTAGIQYRLSLFIVTSMYVMHPTCDVKGTCRPPPAAFVPPPARRLYLGSIDRTGATVNAQHVRPRQAGPDGRLRGLTGARA